VNPALRHSAAHVFVGSLDDPQLDGGDEHHLRRVLRVRESDTITVGDGAGGWAEARLTPAGIVVESDRHAEPAPGDSVVVCAIPKGDRPEWIVQKLTEIGATEIGFMECERSVVRWDADRAARQLDRLRRVAREAAMQSRRVWLPRLLDPVDFGVAASIGRCALADPDGGRLGAEIDTVLVGPEGGFTPTEQGVVPNRVTLSAHVLRVETAALAAALLLTQRHVSR
jgi:16S rRNA (uracil1498-N3)-methyltransferase